MEFLSENWGNIVGLLGLLASVGGLVYAFLARRAAKSAEVAAKEARSAMSRAISSIDVERAVALISRLMELHRQGNWDYAFTLFQVLRRTLSEIASGIPTDLNHHQDKIRQAIPEVSAMANLVNRLRHLGESGEPVDTLRIDDRLNAIQQDLELLQSDMLNIEHRAEGR